MPKKIHTQKILGVPFFVGTLEGAIAASHEGGLFVAPSGPGMALDLARDPAYRAAVTTADLAVPDSGFMVLAWNFLMLFRGHRKLTRVSGLRFLSHLLQESEVQAPGATFWVMPSEKDRDRNLQWLQANGFDHLSSEDCYVAPDYRLGGYRKGEGGLVDEALASIISERAPRWVFVNIGSGVQEPLGHWLRNQIPGKPAIICTGAAIAFLSGGQAKIPPWADRFYLGWLLRILHSPKEFLPRYARASRLLISMLRWRDRLPPLKAK